jgi:hypothetical protein
MKENLEKGIDIYELTTKEKFYLGMILNTYKCRTTKELCLFEHKPRMRITVHNHWTDQVIYDLCTNNILKSAKLYKNDLSFSSFFLNVNHENGDESLFRLLENPSITESNIADIIEILNEEISWHIERILDDAFGEDKRNTNIERLDIFIRLGEMLGDPIGIGDLTDEFDSSRKNVIEKVNSYYNEIYSIISELRSNGIKVDVRENSCTSIIQKMIKETTLTRNIEEGNMDKERNKL